MLRTTSQSIRSIKMRVFMTLILAVLHLISVWLTYESMYYTVSINLNLGVVESLSALKPAISATAFYCILSRPFNRYDIIGILVIMVAIVLLAMNNNFQSFTNGKFSNTN